MATVFVSFLGIYLLIGLLFALWFVFRGLGRLDEGARSAPWYLRLLWLPGAVVLWVILLPKFTKNT